MVTAYEDGLTQDPDETVAHRSAETGQYVTEEFAEKNPTTTVTETEDVDPLIEFEPSIWSTRGSIIRSILSEEEFVVGLVDEFPDTIYFFATLVA